MYKVRVSDTGQKTEKLLTIELSSEPTYGSRPVESMWVVPIPVPDRV
jgi:hypothetical protein